MSNRQGEFTLIFEPDNDEHAVEAPHLIAVTNKLQAMFNVAARSGGSVSPRDLPRLYFAASPEVGSVFFPMIVEMAGDLAIAASIAQLVGIDAKTVFLAMYRVVVRGQRNLGPREAQRLVRNTDFEKAVVDVVRVAVRGRYRSIRVEAEGIRIELRDPVARQRLLSDEMLKAKPARLKTPRKSPSRRSKEIEGSSESGGGARKALADMDREIAELMVQIERMPSGIEKSHLQGRLGLLHEGRNSFYNNTIHVGRGEDEARQRENKRNLLLYEFEKAHERIADLTGRGMGGPRTHDLDKVPQELEEANANLNRITQQLKEFPPSSSDEER